MKPSSVLIVLGAIAAASIGFLVTQSFLISAAILGVGLAFIGLQRTSDWWRRAYIFTIFATGAGASHIAGVAQFGSVAKLLALGLLALVTFANTRSLEPVWAGKTHRTLIFTLWLTVGLAAASIIWSESRADTSTQVLAFIAFVYVLHRTSTTRWKDRAVLIGDIGVAYWASFILLLAGAGLAFVGFPGAVSDYSGRHLGIFNNPNLLGMISALTFALGMGWAIYKRSALVFISLLVPLSQVLLSESRTAILAVVLVFSWTVVRAKAKNFVVLAYLASTMALGAIALSWKPFEGYLDRFSTMDGGDLLNTRTNAWNDVQRTIADDPLGIGWAATPTVLEEWGSNGVASGLNSVHNSYLQLVFELGVAGIIPVLLIVILLTKVGMMRHHGVAIGFGAVALTGLIIQITESPIFGLGQPYPYLFWIAVVAGTVFSEKPDTEEEPVSLRTQTTPALIH